MRFPLFLLCLLSVHSLFAQLEYSVVDENATWVQETFSSTGYLPDTTYFDEYQLAGDTLIEGETFKKLFQNGDYVGALRGDDGRLFHTTETGVDTILDFNLLVGDTVLIGPCYDDFAVYCHHMIVESIDSVALNDGSLRKRLNFRVYNFSDSTPSEETSWIDGVGSTRGLIVKEYCGILNGPESGPYCNSKLLCYQIGDELLLNNSDKQLFNCSADGIVSNTEEELPAESKLRLYPNPAGQQLTVKWPNATSNFEAKTIRIVDALGRTVYHDLEVRAQLYTIDLQSFPSGTYFLLSEQGITTRQMSFIKH